MARSRFLHRYTPMLTTSATWYVVTFCISTVTTIGVTRAYLALTGYPQIGGEVFHLAHALWGGLLLTITTVAMLVLNNRATRWVCSLAGGVGAALFVDEVGKFITQRNDYFFPLAATIVYVFLLLLAGISALLARATRTTPRSHLYAALESAAAIVDGPITASEQQRMRDHIAAVHDSDDARLAAIADSLLVVADNADIAEKDGHSTLARLREWEEKFFPLGRLRWLLRLGLGLIFLGGVQVLCIMGFALAGVNLAEILDAKELAPFTLTGAGPIATTVATLGAIFAILAAGFAFHSALALGRKPRLETAVRSGAISLLIMLVCVNGLLAYFDQFAIIIDLVIEALTLLGLVRFATRYRDAHPDEAAAGDANAAAIATDTTTASANANASGSATAAITGDATDAAKLAPHTTEAGKNTTTTPNPATLHTESATTANTGRHRAQE